MLGPMRPAAAAPEEERPWERPDAFRRDCPPHRGNVLWLLATVALALGVCSFVLPVTGVVSVLLGAAVQNLAACDLAKMGLGGMDPNGHGQTEAAYDRAGWGMLAGAIGALSCVGLAGLLIALLGNPP